MEKKLKCSNKKIIQSLLIGILACWLATDGFSQGIPKEAKDLAEAGVHLFKEGRYKEAQRLFKASYDKAKVKEVIWNLARCHEEIGDFEIAIGYFVEFMKYTNDMREIKRAQEKIETIKQIEKGVIDIDAPQGSVVFIQGTKIGEVPLEKGVWVAPGSYEVVVEKQGFQQFRTTVEIGAREKKTVEVILRESVGEISIVSEGNDVGEVRVFVDGEEKYSGGLPTRITLRPGKRRILVDGKKLVSALEKEVNVEDQRVEVIKVRAKEANKVGLSPVKTSLFVAGLSSLVVGGVLQVWGYVQWKDVTDGSHLYSEVRETRSSVARKYYIAYALYGLGTSAVLASFIIPAGGKHPIGIGLNQDGVSVVGILQW